MPFSFFPMHTLLCVKLGGSLLTDKGTSCTLRPETIRNCMSELLALSRDEVGVVLVHGAGSFGHLLAREHQLSRGITTDRQRLAAAQVHGQIGRLSLAVAEEGHRQGLPLYGLSTASLYLDDALQVTQVEYLLSHGYIPVLHGDMVPSLEKELAILSADVIVGDLARALSHVAEEVVIVHLGEYDGVLGKDGTVLPRIDANQPLDASLFSSSVHVDVTGGMEEKVRTACVFAMEGIPVFIGSGHGSGTLASVVTRTTKGGTWVEKNPCDTTTLE